MTDSIANTLEEFAEFLRLDGQDGRAYAYEKAARKIRQRRQLPPNPANITGIGDKTRTKIAEYQHSGTISELEELKKQYDWYHNLSDINGIGQKRAKQFHEKLNITTIQDLLLVGTDLTLINGIGPKTASNILESAREHKNKNK